MKKRFYIMVAALLFVVAGIRAETSEAKLVFMEYGISYATVTDPEGLANNDTGVYDTPGFCAKVGVNLYEWIDLYAAVSFAFFAERTNTAQHYTFIPVNGGLRINIFPDMKAYPSLFVEYGKSISNRHMEVINMTTMQLVESDESWTGDYYNFGISINLNITDISALVLKIDRPAIKGNNTGEFHIFQIGLAWKVEY